MRLTSVTQLNMKQVTEERATYYPSSRLIKRCVIHVDIFLTYEIIMIKSDGSIIIIKVNNIGLISLQLNDYISKRICKIN